MIVTCEFKLAKVIILKTIKNILVFALCILMSIVLGSCSLIHTVIDYNETATAYNKVIKTWTVMYEGWMTFHNEYSEKIEWMIKKIEASNSAEDFRDEAELLYNDSIKMINEILTEVSELIDAFENIDGNKLLKQDRDNYHKGLHDLKDYKESMENCLHRAEALKSLIDKLRE